MDIKRTVYVLPNLFTTANLFCGVYSLIATLNEKFFHAAIAILIANIFDIADGKVARITNTTSKFGIEYDSLCDLVSFGVAPGLLIYWWALKPFGRYGWMASFLFIACGALRLARFNVMVEVTEKSRFLGLPIPAAASTIASLFLFYNRFPEILYTKNIILLIMTYLLSFLMVSNIKYLSFKELDFLKKRPLTYLFILILFFILIASQPSIMIFFVFLIYALSGPFEFIYKKIFRRGETWQK